MPRDWYRSSTVRDSHDEDDTDPNKRPGPWYEYKGVLFARDPEDRVTGVLRNPPRPCPDPPQVNRPVQPPARPDRAPDLDPSKSVRIVQGEDGVWRDSVTGVAFYPNLASTQRPPAGLQQERQISRPMERPDMPPRSGSLSGVLNKVRGVFSPKPPATARPPLGSKASSAGCVPSSAPTTPGFHPGTFIPTSFETMSIPGIKPDQPHRSARGRD